MRNIKYVSIASLLLATTAVWAGSDSEMMTKPSFYASQTETISAVVEAIDHETRVVTVRKPDGEEITFTASEEARNLGQVSVGDILHAEYQETFSIEVIAGNGMTAEAAQLQAVARTEEGEMPGAMAVDSMIVTATVEEINIEANTFKLKGPEGTINEYVARNPENLKRAAVGDLVVMTVTEAVAITVEAKTAE
jgi:hypothetical protein